MKFPTLKLGWSVSILGITLGVLVLLPHSLRADIGVSIKRQPEDASTRLSGARSELTNIVRYLKGLQSSGFGGYLEMATDDSYNAMRAIDTATTYVNDHPDANRLLAPDQATADSSTTLPTISRGRGGLGGSAQILDSADSLVSTAYRNLTNYQQPGRAGWSGSNGIYLGDLGGNRVKILASLAKINDDLGSADAGVNNPLQVPSAAAAVALNKYQGKITIELADADGPTIVEIPKSLLDGTAPLPAPTTKPAAAAIGNPASDSSGGQSYFAADDSSAFPNDVPAPDTLPLRALLPSIFASIALSGALALGGLHLFSRKGRIRLNVPAIACLIVGALVVGVGITHGDLLPPNSSSSAPSAPPPPPPPLPAVANRGNTGPRGFAAPRGQAIPAVTSNPPPHVSGDATIYVVTTGDSVHIILSRKNAADLLGQPPAR